MTNRASGERTRGPILAIGLALFLTGCGMFGKPNEIAANCPVTGVLAEGERLERYRANSERDLTDLQVRARVGNIRKACSILQEERVLEMDMALQVFAERGPATELGAPLPVEYFVAVTGPNNQVSSRQLFKVAAVFEGTARQAIFNEEIFLSIPIAAGTSVSDYRVVVGLQLTPEELDRVMAAQTTRR
jgi:hypothetical protein